MREIACNECQNAVLVERYTDNQVSIQWTQDAESACAEFARRAAAGERSFQVHSCSALRSTVQLHIQVMSIGISRRTSAPSYRAPAEEQP